MSRALQRIDAQRPEVGGVWLCGEAPWSMSGDGQRYSKGVKCPQRAPRTSMRGEDSPRAEITEADAIDIITSTELYGVLAERYGISIQTVNAIRMGRRWPHLKYIKRGNRRQEPPLIVRLSWKPPQWPEGAR